MSWRKNVRPIDRKEIEEELNMAILLGVQFGVRQSENGFNLQRVLDNAREIIYGKSKKKSLAEFSTQSEMSENNPETVSDKEMSKPNMQARKTEDLL